jgi:hypothetical protein
MDFYIDGAEMVQLLNFEGSLYVCFIFRFCKVIDGLGYIMAVVVDVQDQQPWMSLWTLSL